MRGEREKGKVVRRNHEEERGRPSGTTILRKKNIITT